MAAEHRTVRRAICEFERRKNLIFTSSGVDQIAKRAVTTPACRTQHATVANVGPRRGSLCRTRPENDAILKHSEMARKLHSVSPFHSAIRSPNSAHSHIFYPHRPHATPPPRYQAFFSVCREADHQRMERTAFGNEEDNTPSVEEQFLLTRADAHSGSGGSPSPQVHTQRLNAGEGRLPVQPRSRVKEQLWLQRFAELMAFRAVYGHSNVPQRYAPHKQLGTWVDTQRQSRRSGTLSDTRRRRLESIGFGWRGTGSRDPLTPLPGRTLEPDTFTSAPLRFQADLLRVPSSTGDPMQRRQHRRQPQQADEGGDQDKDKDDDDDLGPLPHPSRYTLYARRTSVSRRDSSSTLPLHSTPSSSLHDLFDNETNELDEPDETDCTRPYRSNSDMGLRKRQRLDASTAQAHHEGYVATRHGTRAGGGAWDRERGAAESFEGELQRDDEEDLDNEDLSGDDDGEDEDDGEDSNWVMWQSKKTSRKRPRRKPRFLLTYRPKRRPFVVVASPSKAPQDDSHTENPHVASTHISAHPHPSQSLQLSPTHPISPQQPSQSLARSSVASDRVSAPCPQSMSQNLSAPSDSHSISVQRGTNPNPYFDMYIFPPRESLGASPSPSLRTHSPANPPPRPPPSATPHLPPRHNHHHHHHHHYQGRDAPRVGHGALRHAATTSFSLRPTPYGPPLSTPPLPDPSYH